MRRKKRRVLIDTNVYSNAYGSKNKRVRDSSQKAIMIVKTKDILIFPSHVSKELLNAPDKKKRKKFRELVKRMKRQGVYVKVSEKPPADNYGFDEKDKDGLIVHDAHVTGSDTLVTDDRTFRNKAKEKTKLSVLSSSSYLARFVRKKNYKRGKR